MSILVADRPSAERFPRTRLSSASDFGGDELVEDILARYEADAISHFAAKIVVPASVADPFGHYLDNKAKARALRTNAVVAAGVSGTPRARLEPQYELEPIVRQALEWERRDSRGA
jgi:nucleoside-diphosphate-sugar epimerase